MSEPYLIAHKVRGKPAFDIAIRMPCPICQSYESTTGQWCEAEVTQADCAECDQLGYWWIISTSGHCAHPYWSKELSVLGTGCDYYVTNLVPDMPDPWPDHYPTASTPPPPDLTAMFTAPKVPPGFKRRA